MFCFHPKLELKKNLNELKFIRGLKYVLDNPKIDKVLVGIDNIFQMMHLVEKLKSKNKFSYPKIRCKDEKLINPYFWNKL